MAITFIQQAAGLGNGANAVVTTSATGAGDLIVVCLSYDGPSAAAGISSITDNATGGSNTYTQCPGAIVNNSGQYLDIWYAKNTRSGATAITVAPVSPLSVEVQADVFEFSGANTTTPFVTATTAGTTGSPVSPSLTPAAAGDVFITSAVPFSVNFTGVSSPFTGFVPGLASGTCDAYYINPPLSATHAAFQPTTSQSYITTAALFAAPATPAGNSQSMFLVF